MNLVKKIMKNDYTFSVFARVMGLVIAIVVSALSARFFGAELKGVMSVVHNDVTLYSIFIGLGIYQAYPFYKKQDSGVRPTYLNNISSLFFIYEAIAIVISGLMIVFHINLYLALAIILMPVEAYIKQLNYIVLVDNPRRRNISSLVISSSEVVLIAVLWMFWEASEVTVLLYYFSTVVVNLCLSFINLRENPFHIRFDLSRILEFIKFGFVPMLVYLCMSINYKVDIQMLKWFDNVTYADIGIYGTGVSLASRIWLIPDAVKDILLSKLVNGKKEDEVAKVIRINLALSALSTIALIVIGKPFILLLYGQEFVKAYYVMIYMLIGVMGMIFYKMIYSYNISQGKRVVNLIFLGAAAIVNIIGNAILIPYIGIWGAVTMSVGSYVLCGVCFLVYFRKKSGISYRKILIMQKEDFMIVKKLLFKKK